MNDSVLITRHGHSCFTMQYGAFSLVVDPYADKSVPGCAPLRLAADAVYCSHGHGDHGAVECVSLTGAGAPEDFSVEEFSVPHDDCGGAKRGANIARLFRFGRLSVAHMGDAGCIPEEDVLAALRGCDVLMVPVGGFYTIDADTAYELTRLVAPRCVIPMHYRGRGFGYDVLDTLDAFTSRFVSVTKHEGTLTVTEDAPCGCVVLE